MNISFLPVQEQRKTAEKRPTFENSENLSRRSIL